MGIKNFVNLITVQKMVNGLNPGVSVVFVRIVQIVEMLMSPKIVLIGATLSWVGIKSDKLMTVIYI